MKSKIETLSNNDKEVIKRILTKDDDGKKKALSFVITEKEGKDFDKICQVFKIKKVDFLRLMISNTMKTIN